MPNNTHVNTLFLCVWLQVINKVKFIHQGEGHIKVKVKYLHPFRFYVVHTFCKRVVCIRLNAFLLCSDFEMYSTLNRNYVLDPKAVNFVGEECFKIQKTWIEWSFLGDNISLCRQWIMCTLTTTAHLSCFSKVDCNTRPFMPSLSWPEQILSLLISTSAVCLAIWIYSSGKNQCWFRLLVLWITFYTRSQWHDLLTF